MSDRPPQQVIEYARALQGRYHSTWGIEVYPLGPNTFAITVFSGDGTHIDHCELMEA